MRVPADCILVEIKSKEHSKNLSLLTPPAVIDREVKPIIVDQYDLCGISQTDEKLTEEITPL